MELKSDQSFRRGGTEDCESPSEYFPYMYDLDACYLDQTKHYDLIGATLNKPGSPADSDAFNVDLGNPLHNVYVKQTHFYAVTQDDDEARVEIRLSEACAEKFSENGFHTSEELTTCEFTVRLTAQPKATVDMIVMVLQPTVDCSKWQDNVACTVSGDMKGTKTKVEASLSLTSAAAITDQSISKVVTFDKNNWDTGIRLWACGKDDQYYEGGDYIQGYYGPNVLAAGGAVRYRIQVAESVSDDPRFNALDSVRVDLYNDDNEAGAMSTTHGCAFILDVKATANKQTT